VSSRTPVWMECTIHRSDFAVPMTVREYLSEVRTDHAIWDQMPRRMLRHKTFQQCARLAFGIHGPQWREGEYSKPLTHPVPQVPSSLRQMDTKQRLLDRLTTK
jgi:hypothetical protein